MCADLIKLGYVEKKKLIDRNIQLNDKMINTDRLKVNIQYLYSYLLSTLSTIVVHNWLQQKNSKKKKIENGKTI